MTETRDKVIIEYASVNFDKTANDVKTLKGNLEGVTEVSFNTEKSTASLENKFASLERRFQTTAAQTAQYAKIQKDVNLAVANNPALQDRANEVLKAAEARYLGSGVAVKALAEAHKGLDAQGQAAFHSIRSLTEQLLAGQISTASFAQQIGHLSYAASGQGGLAGAFGQVATMARGMINPLTLAIGTTAALAAGAAYLALQYDKVQVSSQRAIGGAGQRTGTTTSDINSFVAKNASIGTSGLSDKEARGLGESLTETGEIVIGRLHGMSDAVVGFSNQTGKSITEASKVFEDFGRDPLKGVQALTDAFGPLDAGQRKAVDSALQMHDKTALLNVVIDAFAEKARRAAENGGILDKVWRGITTFAGKETVGPSGPEGQLRAAQERAASAQDALSSASQQSAPSPVLDALSEHLARATEEVEKFEAAVDKLKDGSAADALKQLSTEADNVDKALIPQIGAIDQLKTKIEELNAARAAGTTSKYGSDIDSAALQAAQNQLAALQQAQAEAARYNIEVANISTSWGKVGQSTALQLQAMHNALPVAQQWTEAGRMKAQQEATFLDLLNKGKTAEEAGALAAAQYETSKASAVANAQKLVQSSQDNLALVKAQGTGMEDVVTASIAYRDAVQAGATATQAAQIAANSLAASYERAAQAAQSSLAAYNQQAQALVDKENGTQNGIITPESQAAFNRAHSGSMFAPVEFAGFKAEGEAGTNRNINLILRMLATQQAGGVQGDVLTAYQGGGIAAALQSIINSPNTTGADPGAAAIAALHGYNLNAILGPQRDVTGDKISAYDQIVQLQNSMTSDKGAQADNLQGELNWLQTLPVTLQRDQKIYDLQNSIDDLRKSTDDLNATNGELLSPYYSQDPRTSHIGFRTQGMATGGEVTVPGGYSANDNYVAQIPVASGEIINVRRPGQAMGSTVNLGGINITVNSNGGQVDANEIGRTVYQQTQAAVKQSMRVA